MKSWRSGFSGRWEIVSGRCLFSTLFRTLKRLPCYVRNCYEDWNTTCFLACGELAAIGDGGTGFVGNFDGERGQTIPKG
jgi:hypothetical protein